MSDSFAVVQVPGRRDVKVYAENQLIARTDSDGTVFVPRLRPYESNRIAIDQADLPLDAQVPALETNAVPYFRSGLVLRFAVKPAQAALLTVMLENRERLPAGAVVRIAGREEDFPVGMNGEVYVTGLEAQNRLRATWGSRSCEFEVPYKPGPDPQPHLGTFVCKAAKR
jgi:outer membrane usher protein